MNLEFMVWTDSQFMDDDSNREQIEGCAEVVDGGLRISAKTIKQLAEVMLLCKSAQNVSVRSVMRCAEEISGELDFFALWASKCTALPPGAWDANLLTQIEMTPVDRGGWAPVAIARDLVYATRLKEPRDFAFIDDGLIEFVVSEVFFESVKKIVPEVYGVPLFSGVRKKDLAKGVFQLAVDAFAPPCIMDESVATLRGYGVANQFLGWPVLPKEMKSERRKILRSSEPWDGDKQSGWIVRSGAGRELVRASDDIYLTPVLTEGSPLHKEHSALWREARPLVDSMENASWGPPWQQTPCPVKLSGVRLNPSNVTLPMR